MPSSAIVMMMGPLPAGPLIRPRQVPASAAVSADRVWALAQPTASVAESTMARAIRPVVTPPECIRRAAA